MDEEKPNRGDGPGLKDLSLVAVFTALIWAGSVVKFPLWPVPVTLQTLCVLLVGLRLRPALAVQSVGLYLVLGALGLPVFSGGSGGWAKLIGPTGGFLWGFVLQAVALSWACEASRALCEGKHRRQVLAGWVFLALWLPYIPGLPWLAFRLGFNLKETLWAGLVPFLPGALLKGVVAWLLAPLLLARRWQGTEAKVRQEAQSSELCR